MRGRGAALSDCVGNIFSPLAGAGQVNSVSGSRNRRQLGVSLDEPAVGAGRDIEFAPGLLGVLPGLEGCAENHHVDRYLAPFADQRILAPHEEVALGAASVTRWHDLGALGADDVGVL